MERLHKYMARTGIASRRRCEQLIASGLVKVNGETVTRPGILVDPSEAKVEINGKTIKETEAKIYLALYKPRNYVTTLHDPQGRRKVTDLIKDIPHRLFPVGRLDYDSEGLLLLTNDGQLTYLITHPSHRIPKTYLAWVEGNPSSEELSMMTEGILLSDGWTSPAKVSLQRNTKYGSLLKITIYEGRKRQIRRMCDQIGHSVKRLKRISIGQLKINGLKPGQHRFLTLEEIEQLKKSAGILS
ncbi:MAG: Pseudouridine synthase [Desulfotomaculum sp. 46_80]|nr:MAG: Pseudouridine synthase [Desulfotomaculum sp. 46_80]